MILMLFFSEAKPNDHYGFLTLIVETIRTEPTERVTIQATSLFQDSVLARMQFKPAEPS